MKYAILVYESADDFAAREDARAGEYWGAYTAFSKALEEAGVLRSGSSALKGPAVATTLRIRDGKHDVQDGPFAETREQLGGLFVVECETLDGAIEWAAKCPSAITGSVEIRPILDEEM